MCLFDCVRVQLVGCLLVQCYSTIVPKMSPRKLEVYLIIFPHVTCSLIMLALQVESACARGAPQAMRAARLREKPHINKCRVAVAANPNDQSTLQCLLR